eukprot:12450926-Alexandrium_andersonii.AAC.1
MCEKCNSFSAVVVVCALGRALALEGPAQPSWRVPRIAREEQPKLLRPELETPSASIGARA